MKLHKRNHRQINLALKWYEGKTVSEAMDLWIQLNARHWAKTLRKQQKVGKKMDINTYVYETVKKDFNPKYAMDIYHEIIDHMTGNKQGNKFIVEYSNKIYKEFQHKICNGYIS